VITAEDTIRNQLIAAGLSKQKVAKYAVQKLFIPYYAEVELLPLTDKAGTRGIIIFENNGNKAAEFELRKTKAAKSGISKPVICDFCYTLRPMKKVAMITFYADRSKLRSTTFYICADIACSLHVRGHTDVLDYAKSQLREDVTVDDRIKRLHEKTNAIFHVIRAVSL
jgi:FBP C-terminal treble-clef zinc-finger